MKNVADIFPSISSFLDSSNHSPRKCSCFDVPWSVAVNVNWMRFWWRLKHFASHCVKSVCIRSYSGTHFPAFGLNMERYSVSLRNQSECGKIRTRITPNTDTFYAVSVASFLKSSPVLMSRRLIFPRSITLSVYE